MISPHNLYVDFTSCCEPATTLFCLLSFHISGKLMNTSFDFADLDNEDLREKRERERVFIVDRYAWKTFEGRFKVMVKGKV